MKKTLFSIIAFLTPWLVNGQGVSISALPSTNNPSANGVLPIADNGATYKLSIQNLTKTVVCNLGTIAGGGVATLNINTNYYSIIVSGSTFTINLPTPTSLTNLFIQDIYGTNTSGGNQIASLQVATVSTTMDRPELGIVTATFTNKISAFFHFRASAYNGTYTFSVVGDAVGLGISTNQINSSAKLFGMVNDGTGTNSPGVIVGSQAPTINQPNLLSPTVDSFLTLGHNHDSANNGGTLPETALALTDNITNNASITAHGFMPKGDNVAGHFYNSSGGQSAPSGSGVPATLTFVYTNIGPNSFTNPAGAVALNIRMIGGGGGGGSGRVGLTNTIRGGGNGGASGAYSENMLRSSIIGGDNAVITITIGGGGPGGAAQASSNSNGNNGNTGTNTTFGTFLAASGGGGGNGGLSGANNGGSASGTSYLLPGGIGGIASATGGIGVTPATSDYLVPGGGASGGGIVATGEAAVAGAIGRNGSRVLPTPMAGGTAGTTAGGNGGDGVSSVAGSMQGGGGAGSGGSSITGNGGNGGNGGNYGGGGAGGGAAVNLASSGSGGNGAPGIAIVIVFF